MNAPKSSIASFDLQTSTVIMVVIPYEIWLHIASFLNKEEIWNLRYLSHVFLDIAMDSRYRTLHFSVRFRKTTEYMSKFERFR